MSRKKLIRVSNLPYHVVARANNREWFYCAPDQSWRVFGYYLNEVQQKYEAVIHAFVLMSNHFHLLATTPQSNLDEVMRYFMRESVRSINRSVGRVNHLFGGPYKWSLISTQTGYLHTLKYIYRNPVKAGLSEKVESYQFSSLRARTRFALTASTLDNPSFGLNRRLAWFNLPYAKCEEESIRLALRRREFQFPKNSRTAVEPLVPMDESEK